MATCGFRLAACAAHELWCWPMRLPQNWQQNTLAHATRRTAIGFCGLSAATTQTTKTIVCTTSMVPYCYIMRLVCFFAVAVLAHAQTAIRCGKLLDVRSGSIISPAVIVINGEKIVQAGPESSLPAPAGVTLIDLSSATCLPGLIDVHTH